MSDPARQNSYRLEILGAEQFILKLLSILVLHFIPSGVDIKHHFAAPFKQASAMNACTVLDIVFNREKTSESLITSGLALNIFLYPFDR
jgi:hypothetical protein